MCGQNSKHADGWPLWNVWTAAPQHYLSLQFRAVASLAVRNGLPGDGTAH